MVGSEQSVETIVSTILGATLLQGLVCTVLNLVRTVGQVVEVMSGPQIAPVLIQSQKRFFGRLRVTVDLLLGELCAARLVKEVTARRHRKHRRCQHTHSNYLIVEFHVDCFIWLEKTE